MDCIFKVEIKLDEEKVLAEGVYYPKDIYKAIIETFKEFDIPRLKSDNEKMLAFGTEKRAKFGKVWLAVLKIEESFIMPYLTHYKWYNFETGEVEDIIKESKK